MIRILFLLIAFITVSNMLMGQDLKNHIWQDRVIVIQTKDKYSLNYQKQLKELTNADKDLRERKIVLYQLENQRYKYTDFKNARIQNSWKPLKDSSLIRMNENENFRIELIGLDSSVKLKSEEVVTKEELFNLIDSMPMRKSELKNKE